MRACDMLCTDIHIHNQNEASMRAQDRNCVVTSDMFRPQLHGDSAPRTQDSVAKPGAA